ncbi:ATP-binding protein [Candidatus Parcubacteria bacterium]|nr:ATP-binding protein [Candidatus Parcubacteria bacterium]
MIFPLFQKKPQKTEEKPITLKDILAPSSFVVSPGYVRIGKRYAKTYTIFSLPRYLHVAWLSPIINLDIPLDLAIYINPYPSELYLKQLLKKITEITAEIHEREAKGKVRDPQLEIAYRDIEELRDKLQSGEEKMFKVGFYLTTYADDEKTLKDIESTLRSILESKLIYIREAAFQQKEGFMTTAPYCTDKIQVLSPLNTEPLSSVFPFTSFDLSANEGIMYGVNLHNNSLILFDRFSLENANMVVFGKSGSGKSYFVKLDALRSLMMGVEVIIVDPENEYKRLAEAVGGEFINISLSSPHHINPLDLPIPRPDENPAEVLRSNILNLVGLMRIMLGGLTPEEDAIMDRALTETYAAKDITPKTDPRLWPSRIPLLEDLERVLEGMEGAESLVRRLRRYTRGTFAQFFNQPTNITTKKQLVVYGVRDMEEELRPIAMFLILRHIWNTVRSELKKRIAILDEAWWIMKHEDGASFLFGLCKRARKYWLGVTTITQDVNDFMASTYGQPIITNSSVQILMKQSPATIDIVQKTFNLTDEEKYLLLECEIGQGIFFAGQKHVLMKVVASYIEDQIITTSPEELAKIRSQQK